ncbi:MAG: D-arabinono-1,4-lactone oxidase [Streptosporangiaceae bacterium]|jgi:FAD-linked oxidoreductase|nr:FAD-linked oxidoreductase [Actinomycetota bacterium]
MRSHSSSTGIPAQWQNWAGNVTARPRRVASPGTAQEVADEVRRAGADGLTVRMTGTGHSFTPAAVTDGVMLRPGRLTAIRSVDAAAGLVTVEAGCPLQVLNAELLARGLALANMGDIQVQTVAGAIQTGTHGTGRDIGGIAAQVAALELVLADGSIVTCSADSPAGSPAALAARTGGASLFDAARVGLGALGVITAVTFRVVPAFLLEAREEPMQWADVISKLDELTGDNEHFEFFWFPHSEGCLTKRNNRASGPPRPLPRWRYWLDDEFLSNTVFGATCYLGRLLPAAIPVVNGAAARALGSRSYVDAAYRVFTSPRRVRFKEQEYAVPRCALADVLAEVRSLFTRRDWRISFPIEVRVTPPDDAWLSTAYGRDTAYIAIHVFHSAPHEEYFRDVEAVMTAVSGRPHWGKMNTANADYLAGVYPRLSDFTALRDALDPERRFGNQYLTRVLGS